MSATTELKDAIDTKTSSLVILSIITGGIYTLMWLYENYKIIDKTTQIRTATNSYFVWIAVFFGLAEYNTISENEYVVLIGLIQFLIANIMMIIWAFRAKNSLQSYALNIHRIDLRMNIFFTLFFNVFYINYCINDLPEVHRKQQILTGQRINLETN